MARVNAAVQLSPLQNHNQAHSGEGASDPENDEDLSQDEETAGILNSASRKNKPKGMEAKPKGFFAQVWPSRATRSTTEVIQDQIVTEDENAPPRIGDIVVPEPVEQEDGPLSATGVPALVENGLNQIISPTTEPEPLLPVKADTKNPSQRKRLSKRPDTYEQFGSASDAELGTKEQIDNRPKRPRGRVRPTAKSLLMSGKKINGESLPMPSQPARSRTGNTMQSPTKSIPDQSNIKPSTTSIGAPTGKKRGRPRKAQSSAQGTNSADLRPSLTEANRFPVSVSANTIPDDPEDVSSILLNPSAIKVSRPRQRHKPSRNTESPESDDGLPDLPEIGQQQISPKNRSKPSEERFEEFAAPQSVIDSKVLKLMLRRANRVGHKFVRASKTLEFVKEPPELLSSTGQEACSFLDDLKSLYVKLRGLKAAKNLDAIKAAHVAITNTVHSLKELSRDILTHKLGNPAFGIDYFDEKPTRKLLIDLYFSIFPKLLESMIIGAEAYNDNGAISTSSLQEFECLTKIYYDLAKTAIDQPASSQPRTGHIPPKQSGILFNIQQPTRNVMPLMKDFRKNIEDELSDRAEAENKAEAEATLKMAVERERMRKENERIQELERRRKVKDIRRRQHEDLARQRAIPVWGQLMKNEDARAESKELEKWAREQAKKARARKGRVNQLHQVDEGDAEADPFADDLFEEQRVSIFGKNNNQQNRTQPWTDKEKTAFVDFLRVYNEPDRYERLAEDFQCSMDEIFAYAKEFQEAMDFAHSEGFLNDKEDEWTYDIWVEPYVGRNRR